MISAEFLAMLVCPASRQPLRAATAAEIAALGQAVAKGAAKSRSGAVVTEVVAEGLVTEDGQVLYPVRDGIPILLSAEGILLSGVQA